MKISTKLPLVVAGALLATLGAGAYGMFGVQRAALAGAAELAVAAAHAQHAGVVGLGLMLCVAAIGVGLSIALARRMSDSLVLAVNAVERIKTGDLSARLDATGADEMAQLLAALNDMQSHVGRTVSSVRRNAEGVVTASTQIAQRNLDLSQRTEQQAAALEETASSMEELGCTVRQNADNAKQANQLAMGASIVAIKGGEVVGQVVNTMKGINDSSRKMADIISVIDSIAFQTNILALNAAVEAARAGEQGRGFAVVASEVRTLAQRSADAAKEIKALIGASVERVEQGTALVDQAGATMHEIVTAIKRVTDIMGEISSASSEQSAGVAQVGEAVNQMDQATQRNAALVEQSAAAAEGLKNQAEQLVQTVARFKLHEADVQASQAHATPTPAVGPAVRDAAVERRGPNRAKNVTRPDFAEKGRSKPAHAAEAKHGLTGSDIKPAAHKTGTDEDWASF